MKLFTKEEYEKFPELDEKTSHLTQCIVRIPQNGNPDFKEGDMVLYLGELSNMPGHVAIATDKGKVLFGYHFDNFCVMPE